MSSLSNHIYVQIISGCIPLKLSHKSRASQAQCQGHIKVKLQNIFLWLMGCAFHGDITVVSVNEPFKPRSHLTCTFAFFFDICR